MFEPERPDAGFGSLPGFLVVSLNNKDNGDGAFGFIGVNNQSDICHYSSFADWGTLPLLDPSEQVPCVALTDKYVNQVWTPDWYEDNYTAHLYTPGSSHWNTLHEYVIDLYYDTPQLIKNDDINIVNGDGVLTDEGGPNGMKVSRHGKLYMWGHAGTGGATGRLFGIDPFSGIIQTTLDVYYGDGGLFSGYPNYESEGLDIIDTTDVGLTSSAPEIIVQVLASPSLAGGLLSGGVSLLLGGTSGTWAGYHISVDDPARL